MKYILAILVLFCAVGAHAQVIAASCNPSDITSAWSSVTSSTTTFIIPAGTCTWTTGNITLTLPTSGNLTIQGSTTITGNCSPGSPTCTATDNTILVDNYASTNPLINVVTQSGCTETRVTGLTIKGGTGSVKQGGYLAVGGFCHSVRVDHNHLLLSTSSNANIGIRYTGWVYGVTDHILADMNTSTTNEPFNVWMDAYGGSGNIDGHAAWPAATAFGTANFMFFENNVVNNGLYADDCDVSGREVFRYNVVNNSQTQTHPTGSSPNANHGCRAKETYQNQLNGVSACNGTSGFNSCLYNGVFFSSGPGLIYSNSFPLTSSSGASSGYQWVFSIQSMRTSNATYPQTVNPGGWGYCGSNFNGTGSAIDQNSSSVTGYLCLDQPGAGQTTNLLSGDFVGQGGSGVLNTTTGTFAWPVQAKEPVYEWLDSLTPIPSNPGGVFTIGTSNGGLTQNTDFYVNQTSSCSGTQTTGVCSGLLSARATTCTAGVGFWATDTTTLYTCGVGSTPCNIGSCTRTSGNDSCTSTSSTNPPTTVPGGVITPSTSTGVILSLEQQDFDTVSGSSTGIFIAPTETCTQAGCNGGVAGTGSVYPAAVAGWCQDFGLVLHYYSSNSAFTVGPWSFDNSQNQAVQYYFSSTVAVKQ